MERNDYFNCLHNTKLSDGNFMSKEDAEILATAIIGWTPLLNTGGKYLIPEHKSDVSFPELLSLVKEHTEIGG